MTEFPSREAQALWDALVAAGAAASSPCPKCGRQIASMSRTAAVFPPPGQGEPYVPNEPKWVIDPCGCEVTFEVEEEPR